MVLPVESFRKSSSVNHTREECVEITEGLIRKFVAWLRSENPRITDPTVRDYVSRLRRALGVRLCGKPDVMKVFKAMGGVGKRNHEAFSRLLTFLDKTRDLDALVAKLRKAMPKKPRSGEDTYVPPDDKVLALGRRLAEVGDQYVLVYNVLVSSGCRGREALYLIQNIRNLRTVKLPYGAVRVHLDLYRGGKNVYALYLPEEVYEQVLRFKGKLYHEDNISKAFSDAGLPFKYLRKWWRQTAKKLGIDSEDIEAFQGRPRSIGGIHYTDWIPILDRDYSVILPKIKQFLIT